MSLSSIKSKKDLVLNETIAQSIMLELKELLADPGQGQRCLMELIQNAADATKGKVNTKIVREGDKVTFSHDGRPFSDEELLKLVYHGSSKGAQDETSGKLGTGFLASHLMSMQTTVSSSLDGTLAFTFTLDRQAEDAHELAGKMKVSWDELEKQLSESIPPQNENTNYAYVMSTDVQRRAYESGKTMLSETAAIILAFDERLNSISIKDGVEEVWTASHNHRDADSEIVEVRKTKDGKDDEAGLCHFIIKRKEGTAVAIPSERRERRASFASMEKLPKLYYPMPFTDTSGFPFPALVADRGFLSTRNRETPTLTSSTQRDVLWNKSRIEVAFELLEELLNEAIDLQHDNRHNLGRLPGIAETEVFLSKHKVDQVWLGPLVSSVIRRIGTLPVVLTSSGYIMTNDSKIPYLSEDQTQQLVFWRLVSKLYVNLVPKRELAETWGKIEGGWIEHCDAYAGKMEYEEIVTLDTLTNLVNGESTITGLDSKLGGVAVLGWLNGLVRLIQSVKKDEFFVSKKLLPTQAGTFDTSKQLYNDPGVSEGLKTIASNLGYDIRTMLLHRHLISQVLPKSLGKDVVLAKVLELVKYKAKTKSDYRTESYQKANIDLLNWLVQNEKISEISESFPVITREKEDYEKEGKDDDYIRYFTDEAIFLSPPSTWDEKNRDYVDVFPSRAILSDIYSTISEETWKELEDRGLVLKKLITQESEPLGSKEMVALSMDEVLDDGKKTVHTSIEPVSLSSIAFMREKNWGVFDRIGESRDNAARFLMFVMRNLIKSDSSWKMEKSIQCSCKSAHVVRPALWLAAIATRQWVPVPGEGTERPSLENLVSFFSQDDLRQTLSDEDTIHFLAVLNIGVGSIVTAKKSKRDHLEYERAVSKLIAAANMDAHQLSILATAYSDSDVRKEMLKVLDRKKFVHDNQMIGELVERILRDQLRLTLKDDQLSVSKVRVARDAVVEGALLSSAKSDAKSDDRPQDIVEYENDVLDEDGTEVLFQISGNKITHSVEIKSARGSEVHMTVPQAREAKSNNASFTLCVVPVKAWIADLSEEEATKMIVANARFVHPIGAKLATALSDIESIQNGEKHQEVKTETTPEDVEAAILDKSQLRVRIKEPIWKQGINLQEFAQILIAAKDSIPPAIVNATLEPGV